MNMRNIVRTYNYLSPRQKMAVAIAAIVGGGVLLCIPLLSLQPPRSPVASSTGAVGNPNGGQNPSGTADVVPSQAPPLDTTNPVDLPTDSSFGATESDTFGSGNGSNFLGGDGGSNALDTAEPVDERVANRQRSSASLNDTSSNNIDNPYSQSTIRRYQTPASIGNSPYGASPGSNLSTTYSRAAGGSSSMSQSSSRLPNLEPAKGNDFTYLNPFSPNSGAGTTGVNPNTTNLPGNPSAIPSQSAIAPSGLNSTGEGGMNATPTNGSRSGFAPQTPAQTVPTPTRQNPSFSTPSAPGNMPNR